MSDKLIELIKWTISSVCIVIVTLIIDTGFREREAGIKEMEVYDKYVDIILQADNIEQRWKLCEYFSIVTPTERLRTRWQAYRDSISKDYYLWKSKQRVDSILIDDSNDKPLISSGNSDYLQLALSFESSGFYAILSKDVNLAISNFTLAEKNVNGLHNCYEISRYLIKNKKDLLDTNSKRWTELGVRITTEWPWGLSEDLLKRIKDFSK